MPANQFMTNAVEGTGHNEPWRYSNRANTATHQDTPTHTTRQPGHNNFQYNSPNLSDNRRGINCYRCGELGHIKAECKERVFCTTCRSSHHDTQVCKKHCNNTPSPTNNNIPTGYHPTVTPPPLIGTTTGGQPTQQTNTTNGHYLQNLLENQTARNNMVPTPQYSGTSPTPSANMTEAFTQILAHVTNNKNNDISRQLMKNIKIFDGTNKAECLTWLSQIEAVASFSNKPFRELICQSMAPSMLHILSELPAAASDEDIKNAILTNYSDIPQNP